MEYQRMLVTLAAELRPARFRHSREVSRTAVRLAEHWNADIEKARIAGILHDCARILKSNELLKAARDKGLSVSEIEIRQPALLHARLGEIFAKERFEVEEPDILQAIRRHTTGSSVMTLLDKIIYLADFIEPGRNFPGVEHIRELAMLDVDEAMLAAYDHTICFVVAEQGLLHPDTIDGRNSLLMEMKAKQNGK
jgi:predicted HD superfamily hydrolase involved in NAD metabolism